MSGRILVTARLTLFAFDTQADQRLLDWLGAGVAVKVISTATAPLLPRIERGVFLDSLYYRLNTICVFMIGAEEWHGA